MQNNAFFTHKGHEICHDKYQINGDVKYQINCDDKYQNQLAWYVSNQLTV